MAWRRDKDAERGTAQRRVGLLLARARAEALGGDGGLAARHTLLARRVAQRYQLGLGGTASEVCRGCSAYRLPGRNTRVRLRRGRVVTTCLACGRVRRRPLGGAA